MPRRHYADEFPFFYLLKSNFHFRLCVMDSEEIEVRILNAEESLEARSAELIGSQARLKVFRQAHQALPKDGSASNKIEEKIEQEEKAIAEIRKSIIELNATISALVEIRRILSKPDRQFTLRPTSELFRVEQFIRSKGGPVHLDDIMRGIGVEGEEKKKSLRGSLRSYARDGRIFVNGPMVDSFTLIGLQEAPSILSNPGGANGIP
jgi:hypothetical protein